MNKLDLDFSFRKGISEIKNRSQSASRCTLHKDFTNVAESLNNTSRFEEKKVLRKLKEQDLLNRM